MDKLFIHPAQFKITQKERIHRMNQRPALLWFTGLSGSGKSTLANAVESYLFENGFKTYILDGDNIRTGLSSDLTFSNEDRIENIRRIAEVSKLFLDAGIIVLSAFISPFRSERQMIADLVGSENFIEIFVDCPLEICEKRDVKGLYQKARNGLIANFTGIDSPYETPNTPFITVKTNEETLDNSLKSILENIYPKITY